MKQFIRRTVIIALATCLLVFVNQASAQYGRDVYGGCAFGQSCAEPIPPTVVEVPPTTDNPASGRVFSVNITDGQVFSERSYTVEVTPNFSHYDIAKVRFFAGDALIGETSELANASSYHIPWVIDGDGTATVRIEVELVDGTVIDKVLSVKLAVGIAPSHEAPPGASGTHDNTDGGVSGLQRAFPSFIPEGLESLIRRTPKPIAYAIPYFFLSLLGAFAATLLWQARNQMQHAKVLLALLRRDKELADEKTNFVMLASHYMRTPITVINGSLELAPRDEQTAPFVARMQASTKALQQRFEAILQDITDNKDIARITTPDVPQAQKRLTMSWRVIGPIALSAVLIVITNLLFVAGQRIRLVIPNILLQVVLWLVVTYVVLVFWQRRQDARRERLAVESQRHKEEVLDHARNTFIQRAAEELRPDITVVHEASGGLPKDSNTERIQKSVQQLKSTIDRFSLAALLERGRIQNEASLIELNQLISTEITALEPVIQAKAFVIDAQTEPLQLSQNQVLLRYVIHSLLDNATKHTPAGNKITIRTTKPSRHRAQLRIRNYGVGMTEDQIGKLFRPFSRTASSQSFQDEGIGLGLYLSRLIMGYLGGDLSLESTSAKSTLAQLDVPTFSS